MDILLLFFCVKLSREDLIQYRQISNFWWMCDQRIDTIRKMRNHRIDLNNMTVQATTPKPTEIERIDGEIAELKEQIVALHQSLLNGTATATRVETSDEKSKANRPLAESSLLSLPETSPSTKPVDCLGSIEKERSPNDRFWLFITKVKNCVTEQQILKLVTDSLGTEDVVIKKLVPAWKDTTSLPYISFKVGVNVRLKSLALLSSTWPAGLSFREFRDYVWEPL